MKLREAMKEVFESDVAWITKENALQVLALIVCLAVIGGPWIPLLALFNPLFQNFGLPFLLAVFCLYALSAIWSLFWFRVFNKWWPY